MRNLLIIGLLAASSAIGWYFGYQTASGRTARATAKLDRNNKSPSVVAATIKAQGKLLPASGMIRVFASPGERIDAVTEKKVGDVVSKDELLLSLHSRQLREKDLQLVKARRADALANRDYEMQQAQFKLKSAQLAWEAAEANEAKLVEQAKSIELMKKQRELAEQAYQRLQRLQSNFATANLVNQFDLDKQSLAIEQLKLQIELATQKLELAKQSVERAKQSALNNLKTVQYSLDHADQVTPEKSLQAAVDLAQQAYEMTEIRAPGDDLTILDVLVNVGDTATNQPVMVLGNTSVMECEAEVVDDFLETINLANGKLRAKITAAALPKPLLGTVIAKGILVGPVSLPDPSPFAKVDQRIGSVMIRLDDAAIASRFVNLQVDVEIETQPGTLSR